MLGAAVAAPMDIANGESFNLLNRKTVGVVRRWITEKRFYHVHFGTPCTHWTLAKRDAGRKDTPGFQLACVTVELMRLCRKQRVGFTIEHPRYSRLWSWAPIAKELHRNKCGFAHFDMCVFGAAWRKPTTTAGTPCGLQA